MKTLRREIGKEPLVRIKCYIRYFDYIVHIIDERQRETGWARIETKEFVKYLDRPYYFCDRALRCAEDMRLITSELGGYLNKKKYKIAPLGKAYIQSWRERLKLDKVFYQWAQDLIKKRRKVQQALDREYYPQMYGKRPFECVPKDEKDKWRLKFQG